jgi:ABC-type multidrug transport system fused ATPase/permease subunit
MALPYPEFIQKNSADMIVNAQYRTGDVAGSTVSGLVTLASEGAILAGVGVTLALVQPVLAAGVLVFMGLVGTGLLVVLAPAARRVGHEETVESMRAQQALQESMGGIKAIKANELTSKFLESFSVRRDALASVRRRKVFLLRLPVFYLESALFLGLGVLAVVVFHTASRDIVPILGLLVAAAFRMLPSVSRILGTITAVRNAESPLGFIERDLAGPPVQTTTSEGPHVSLDEELSVRRVGFRYPGAARDALAAIGVDIAAGESIGLVGSSGSGKTTFVDIILGLLEPTEGELLVDGQVLTAERLPGWRRTIGYVPQDVFLVDGSIRENIVFGRQVDDDGRLVEAVKLAQLDTVVADLPEGLETFVGERGVRLSGGQRQRIGIARALYNRPSLLILDEATSALDTKTEAAITESIEALRGRTTTIVIAHRLSTVQHCDRIIHLDEGRIKAVGTFDELRREGTAFAELVRLGQLAPEGHAA